MHATTIRRWKKERVGRLYIKKMEREGRKAVHKGAGKRGWEGCPMKETEGESGKAVQ